MQFLTIALFLYGMLQVSLGCSCAYSPFVPFWKTQICRAALDENEAFFIEAIVIGERKAVEPSEFYTDNSYDVNILENYGNELGTRVDTSKLYTAHDGALCGINGLQKGEKYDLSGYISNGKLRIGLCNFFKKWDDITTEQKQFMKSKFRDCQFPGYGCLCERDPRIPYWQEQICRASYAAYSGDGFVIRADVTGGQVEESQSEWSYAIKVQGPDTFASPAEGVDKSKVYIENGRCAITLQEGNTYILSGTVRKDGKLIVSACDFVKLWSAAKDGEKRAVNNPEQFCPLLQN